MWGFVGFCVGVLMNLATRMIVDSYPSGAFGGGGGGGSAPSGTGGGGGF